MTFDDVTLLATTVTAEDLVAKTAAFVYAESQFNKTGDPDKDLTKAMTRDLLLYSEELLIHIGILPEDWESIV